MHNCKHSDVYFSFTFSWPMFTFRLLFCEKSYIDVTYLTVILQKIIHQKLLYHEI